MTSVREVETDVRPPAGTVVSRTRAVFSNDSVGSPSTWPLWRRSGWALLLFIVFCLSAELACRVDDRITYGVPLLSRVRSVEDLLVFDRDGWHGRPDARYRKWTMNALGMRGPAAPLLKAPGSVRVIVVGASEAFGLYESPHNEFPRQLEDSLNAELARGRCANVSHFEVLNAALPGMSLPTIEHDVRTRIRRLRPEVILYYPTPAQYLNSEPPRVPRTPRAGPTSVLPAAAALHSRLADRLRDQAKLLIPSVVQDYLRRRVLLSALKDKPAGWRFTTLPSDRLDAFERDLRTLVGSIRGVGAVPVLATHANAFAHFRDESLLGAWERFYPRAAGDVILQFETRSRETVRRVAADSSVAVADVGGKLADVSAGSFSDFAHFTDTGSAHVADVLQRVVLETASRYHFCGTSRNIATSN